MENENVSAVAGKSKAEDLILIEEALKGKQREQWLAENKAAIDAYNEHVESHGVFSDGLRSF